MKMLDHVELTSGIKLSVKTFRPLWVFPWTCSVWRQFPMQGSIATIAFDHRAAAQAGHAEVVKLLRELDTGPDMSELFDALESYARAAKDKGVRSSRIYRREALSG